MSRQKPPKFHRGGVKREEWIVNRIGFLQKRIQNDAKELVDLVNPTIEEIQECFNYYDDCRKEGAQILGVPDSAMGRYAVSSYVLDMRDEEAANAADADGGQ